MIREPYPNELYHHGILGQKWGRRRFQNADGSYTAAGRARYGILGKKSAKRKLSKDAQMRAKARTAVKNEQAKRDAAEAKTARLKAETEAKRAKEEYKQLKKETSPLKNLPKLGGNRKSEKLSRNEQKFADALQSGNKRKIDRIASKLNNNEYRRAVERVNMKYDLERAKDAHLVEKGKHTAAKVLNVANTMKNTADIYNVVAGTINAFGGNVPKLNTSATDPLDRMKKMYEAKEAKAKKENAEINAASAKRKEETAILKQKKDEAAARAATERRVKEAEAELKRAADEKATKEWINNALDPNNDILAKVMPRRSFSKTADTTDFPDSINWNSTITNKRTIANSAKAAREKMADEEALYAFLNRNKDKYGRLEVAGKTRKKTDPKYANAPGFRDDTFLGGISRDYKDVMDIKYDDIPKNHKDRGFTVVNELLSPAYSGKVTKKQPSKKSTVDIDVSLSNPNAKSIDRFRFRDSNKDFPTNVGKVDVSKLPKDQQDLFFAMLNSKGYIW